MGDRCPHCGASVLLGHFDGPDEYWCGYREDEIRRPKLCRIIELQRDTGRLAAKAAGRAATIRRLAEENERLHTIEAAAVAYLSAYHGDDQQKTVATRARLFGLLLKSQAAEAARGSE